MLVRLTVAWKPDYISQPSLLVWSHDQVEANEMQVLVCVSLPEGSVFTEKEHFLLFLFLSLWQQFRHCG